MAELNKAALTSENNNSFPNNNTGFITPDLLRTFNQNMIDSMVDEISYNADSASFSSSIALLKDFSSSLDNTYATDAQLSASVAASPPNKQLELFILTSLLVPLINLIILAINPKFSVILKKPSLLLR